eukprot:scaffold3883_cov210-Pinguiococcus_pyrenoidosus.AAC.3
MNFAHESKQNWPPHPEEKTTEELEEKDVAATPQEETERREASLETPLQIVRPLPQEPVFPDVSRHFTDDGNRTCERMPFDHAFYSLYNALRRMESLGEAAKDRLTEIQRIVQNFRLKTYRYDYDIFQKVITALERLETEQMQSIEGEEGDDDETHEKGVIPGFNAVINGMRRVRLRGEDPDPEDEAQAILGSLQNVRAMLEDLINEPYKPSPHGDAATVVLKKFVQGGNVVVASLEKIPIPGIHHVIPALPALSQALQALDTHLTAMANEGDYVADARANIRSLHSALQNYDDLDEPHSLVLQRVGDVVGRMKHDVDGWAALPWWQKHTALEIRGGVTKAIDFEAKMNIHNNNLKDALLILNADTGGKVRTDLRDHHSSMMKGLEDTQNTVKKASGETRMIVRETSAETNGLVQEAIEVAEDTRKKMDDSFEKTQEL